MATVLDYERLCRQDVDYAMRDFLVRVTSPDLIRLVRVQFAQFFTEEQNPQTRIPRSALVRRQAAIIGSGWYDTDTNTVLRETFSWFGIPLRKLVHSKKRESLPGEELLPRHVAFEKRTRRYNGLTAREPWLISLSETVRDREGMYLVLNLLPTRERDPSHFVWVVNSRYIGFNE